MSDDNGQPQGGDFPDFPGATEAGSSADPETDAGIAALLASLDPPAMPPEVAARLDAVIADEARARRDAPAHHLRKLVIAWGVAAAAVVTVVAGVGVVADNFFGGAGSSSDSQVTADSKALSSPESGGHATALPVIHADRLAGDARELASTPAAGRVVAPDSPTDLACPAPREPRPDRLVMAVDYKGADGEKTAILIITTQPPRTATVFACDGTRLQQVALD